MCQWSTPPIRWLSGRCAGLSSRAATLISTWPWACDIGGSSDLLAGVEAFVCFGGAVAQATGVLLSNRSVHAFWAILAFSGGGECGKRKACRQQERCGRDLNCHRLPIRIKHKVSAAATRSANPPLACAEDVFIEWSCLSQVLDDRARHSRVQQTADREIAASAPAHVINPGALTHTRVFQRSRSWTDSVSTVKASANTI